MKAEIKEAWIKALRSGEYAQTRSCLRDENGFCCLGVLCDIAVKAGVAQWDKETNEEFYSYSIQNENGTIPNSIAGWAGIELTGNEFSSKSFNLMIEIKSMNEEGSKLDLSDLNDSRGYTFANIADVLETQDPLPS